MIVREREGIGDTWVRSLGDISCVHVRCTSMSHITTTPYDSCGLHRIICIKVSLSCLHLVDHEESTAV